MKPPSVSMLGVKSSQAPPSWQRFRFFNGDGPRQDSDQRSLILMAERGGLSVRTGDHQVVDGIRKVSAADDASRYVITGYFAVLSKNRGFEDSSQLRSAERHPIEYPFRGSIGACQKEPRPVLR
jgi:hypothetical protein